MFTAWWLGKRCTAVCCMVATSYHDRGITWQHRFFGPAPAPDIDIVHTCVMPQLRSDMPSSAIFTRAVKCYAVKFDPRHAGPCHAVLCHCCAVSCCAVRVRKKRLSLYLIPCIAPHAFLLSCCVMLCCAVPCCAVRVRKKRVFVDPKTMYHFSCFSSVALSHAVLCCAMLCCQGAQEAHVHRPQDPDPKAAQAS
jgi:hypothetical protein